MTQRRKNTNFENATLVHIKIVINHRTSDQCHLQVFQMFLLILLGFLALPNQCTCDQVHFGLIPHKHPQSQYDQHNFHQVHFRIQSSQSPPVLLPSRNMINTISTNVTIFGFRPQLHARALATKWARCAPPSQTEQGLKNVT